MQANNERAAGSEPVERPKTTAFFFGSSARPLFGLYGPPRSAVDREHAVLLCPPIGHEYMRAHWGLRLLGDDLIDSGFHVMRFDYSCMGDSAGAFEQASVEQWVNDIQVAAAELQDNAGVRKVSMIGFRLGATLACAAVNETPLHHLVLADPVLSGRVYLDRLRGMQTALRESWPDAPTCIPGAAHEELLGYCYPANLVDQIAKMEFGAAETLRANRVSWVLSADNPACKKLHDEWEQKFIKGEFRVAPETANWEAAEDGLFAETMLLPKMRSAVVGLLGEGP